MLFFMKRCPLWLMQISLLKNRVNIASGTPSRLVGWSSHILLLTNHILFVKYCRISKFHFRIKKLIDAEALDLSRLQVLVLDLHPDVKGYSLLTLPQVRFALLRKQFNLVVSLLWFCINLLTLLLTGRDEFWDLFKNYFYQPMLQGHLRICLYGYQVSVRLKAKHKHKQGHTIPDA